jgi:hypothetical protein
MEPFHSHWPGGGSGRLHNCIVIRGGLHEVEFVRPPGDPIPLIVIDAGVTVYLEGCHLVLNGQPLEHYVQCGSQGPASPLFYSSIRN